MASDPPPVPEPPGHAGPQPKMIVTKEAVVIAGNACRCAADEICYPVSVAKAALQNGPVSPDAILAFRRDLDRAACEHKGSVALSTYQELLGRYAFQPIWGRGHDRTLAEAITADLARAFHFAAGQEPAEFQTIASMYVDQGVGRLGRSESRRGAPLVAYDPAAGNHPEKRPSLWAYAKVRAYRDVVRAARRSRLHQDFDLFRDDPDFATQSFGESEVDLASVRRAVRESGDLLRDNQQNELRLLDLLEEALDLAPPRRRKRESHLRLTINIARRVVAGEAECCIWMDCGTGDPDDPPPLNLGIGLTVEAAARHGSRNTTVLKGQLSGWTRILLGLGTADADRSMEVRDRVRASLLARQAAWELLHHVTPIVADLHPDEGETIRKKWTGPPARDRHDDLNGGDAGVSGFGIAFTRFLFGFKGLGDDLRRLCDPA